MGTHPIFESDFDCLTEVLSTSVSTERQTEMADLDDALVNYLTDKYSADAENGDNDAEMDDIPDSASVGGRSEGSSDESDSESEASEDSDSSTDTVMDNKAAKDEADKQRRKEKREERRAKKSEKRKKKKKKKK